MTSYDPEPWPPGSKVVEPGPNPPGFRCDYAPPLAMDGGQNPPEPLRHDISPPVLSGIWLGDPPPVAYKVGELPVYPYDMDGGDPPIDPYSFGEPPPIPYGLH